MIGVVIEKVKVGFVVIFDVYCDYFYLGVVGIGMKKFDEYKDNV